MKRTLFCLMLLAASLAGVAAAENQAKPAPAKTEAQAGAIKNIGVQEFEKLRRDTNNVVLDVRTPKEFASGHMPGAVNIDYNSPEFAKKIVELDKNKTYLVHCAVGGRSAKACDKLSQLNFGHLYNLEGGMRAWVKAGNEPKK
jgi:rhodanese-related sulfurtransferase